MSSRPELYGLSAYEARERTPFTLFVDGSGFEAGATLHFGITLLPMTLESSERGRVEVPDTLLAGTYDLFVRNTDGGMSGSVSFELHTGRSKVSGPHTTTPGKYVNPGVDQRAFILPAPFNMRTDSQRIAAGSQYTGEVPDAPQGLFKDGGPAPTVGGRWAYNEDIVIKQLDFRASGVEPGGGRGAGSGWYIFRKGDDADTASPRGTQILDVSGVDIHVMLTAEYRLKQGDVLYLFTTAATLEMIAAPTVVIERPYL